MDDEIRVHSEEENSPGAPVGDRTHDLPITCGVLQQSNIHAPLSPPPAQWEAADAEIKVPFGENTELKCPPFKAWSRSVYNQTCYAYCQEFLPCFRSIHLLFFFQNLSRFLPALAVANTGSCVSPQDRIGHPAGCRLPC